MRSSPPDLGRTRTEAGAGASLPYLPALDGLRGVAVLAVVGYHLGVPWLRGGYLGVDVFFVLSGFLITGLLLTEVERTGRIDLADFWLRRARRLLPALLLVLVAVSAYAAALAQPAQRAQLRGDGFATLLYYANWHFVLSEQSYFAQYGDPSPLRHTWSLAIEEQWYLVLPLAMAGLLALGLLRRRSLAVLLGLLAVASAVWAATLYDPDLDPSRVYYGTDTRLHALLVGAVLACLAPASRRRHARTYVRVGPTALPLSSVAGLVCGAALAVALSVVPESSPALYRGGFLLVAVATAVVIHTSSTSSLLGAALGSGPLRRVGVVSYGLYLWHWPVIVVLSVERTGTDGLLLGLLRVAAMAVLTVGSFVLVERPIRRGALRTLRPGRWAPLVVAVAATVGVAGTVFLTTPPDPAAATDAQDQRAPSSAGRRTALLVGDSTAFNLGYPWSASMTPGWNVGSSTQLGCGVVRGGRSIGGTTWPAEPKCETWPQDWAAAVSRDRPDVAILMAGAWEVVDHVVDGRTLRVGSAEYGRHLRAELDTAVAVLAAEGARVDLMTVPCFADPDGGMYGPDLAAQRNDPRRQAWLNEQLAAYARDHAPAVRLLDVRPLLCDGDAPRPTVDGLSAAEVRYDGVHFTPAGATLAWSWLTPRLDPSGSAAAGTARAFFFLGDSVPYQLRRDTPALDGGTTFDGATLLGCGIVNDTRVMDDKVLPLPPQCRGWDAEWSARVRSATYDTGVLWPGIGELFDHRVDGRTIRFGTPEGDAYVTRAYRDALDALAQGGRGTAVVLMPCHGVAGSQPEARVINDEGRIRHLNALARTVAEERGATVVDLHTLLCADGYRERLGGVRLREDGLHFSVEGGRRVLDAVVAGTSAGTDAPTG